MLCGMVIITIPIFTGETETWRDVRTHSKEMGELGSGPGCPASYFSITWQVSCSLLCFHKPWCFLSLWGLLHSPPLCHLCLNVTGSLVHAFCCPYPVDDSLFAKLEAFEMCSLLMASLHSPHRAVTHNWIPQHPLIPFFSFPVHLSSIRA